MVRTEDRVKGQGKDTGQNWDIWRKMWSTGKGAVLAISRGKGALKWGYRDHRGRATHPSPDVDQEGDGRAWVPQWWYCQNW